MKTISIASALLLILCLVSLIPVSQTTQLTIMASFDNTVSQVMQPGNWKNWYPNIKKSRLADPSSYRLNENKSARTFTITAGGDSFHIDQRTPLSYRVHAVTDGRPAVFAFAVLPMRSPDRTEIVVGTRTRLLYRLLRFVRPPSPGVAAIIGLRSYLEDVQAFYGYPIAIRKVTDTVYLTAQALLGRHDLFKRIPGLFSEIDRFIRDKDLRIADDPAVSYGPLQKDSLHVMAGIPVNRMVAADGPVTCMQMPKGRMLVGRYDGAFAGRAALYAGMQRYMADHHLSAVADPFERYTDRRLPVSDSSTIHIELYFPIR